MPGITLHFVLAQRALERWRSCGERIPFDPDDPDVRNAFFHGAVGPDLGYLPGGYRPLSDLAHRDRTGALTSRLIRSARTPLERAFGWGWLTHVVGDREIHPWIGRGVGELLERGRAFVPGAEDPLSHLRVEIGVDCWYADRHEEARSVRLRPVFDDVSIAFLRHAYAFTYGVDFGRNVYLRSHRCVGRRVGQGLALLPFVGTLVKEGGGRLALPGIRWLLGTAYRSAALRGFSLAYLNPVSPSEWLLARIDEAVGSCCERFLDVVRRGGHGIGDFDLDTGEPITGRPCPSGTAPGTVPALAGA